jgi:hypothetical protein
MQGILDPHRKRVETSSLREDMCRGVDRRTRRVTEDYPHVKHILGQS